MPQSQVIIIAEAGVNHNGSLSTAKALIDSARGTGADFVKFQTFISERSISATATKAEYQKHGQHDSESQLEMVRRLELPLQDFETLRLHAEKVGIGFLSTGFDFESVALLGRMKLPFFKIASGEVTNLPLLEQIGSYGSQVLLSTGMSELAEIESAIQVLEKSGTPRSKIIVLQCTSNYPARPEDANLLAMLEMRERLGVRVGYSDHTLGIEVALAAVALGAEVIEKHFTLDQSAPGPDHRASLEPIEFAKLVEGIRKIELARGQPQKKCSASEQEMRRVARKSIVARSTIRKGEALTRDNLDVKRPGTGMSPMGWHQVLGRNATRNIEADELIQRGDFE